MTKLVFATFLVSLVVASTPGPLREQQFEDNKQAEVDADGNIYVSSDQGKLIWMGNTKRCSELGNTLPSLQLEIYRKGGHKVIIETGAPIGDWRFWKDGSTRTQRTYVYKDCPYIKVTVHFKALEGESSALDEDLDDIIESLSQPFLVGITVD